MINSLIQTILLAFFLALNNAEEVLTTCALPSPTLSSSIKALEFGVENTKWNYVNPTNWKELVSTCNGQRQTPIDLPDVTTITEQTSFNLHIEYIKTDSKIEYEVVKKPYTLEIEGTYDEVYALDKSGQQHTYISKQFHLHHPSEHTIAGVPFDLEVHFVHLTKTGECDQAQNLISVLGVLFQVSSGAQPNQFLADWIAKEEQVAQLQSTSQPSEVKITSFDLYSSFLKVLGTDPLKYISYEGGLTTPPCTETVNWFVLTSPILIPSSQVDQIKSFFKDSSLFPDYSNNRPIQPRNDRKLTYGTLQLTGVNQLGTQNLVQQQNDTGKDDIDLSQLITCVLMGLVLNII